MSFHNIIEKVTGQPPSHIKKQQYHFGRTLGAGTFGVVKYATQVETGKEVAVKIILKKTLKGNEQMVLDELKMLKKLSHPHIVRFEDWFESKDKFYIVTQLATGGELFDRICDYGRFTEHDASRCVREVAEAVQYLHQRNIVHRDLKPENLLYVTPAVDSELVLADFGIAKDLNSPEEQLTTMAGSFGYAAPEILRGTGHGKPCDIWSLGVVCYTILSGYSPFRSENVNDFLEEVTEGYTPVFHERYWKDVSPAAKEFVTAMLQHEPSARPTADQIMKDPWLVGDAARDTTDLLPNIREGFNARKKFRKAIEAIRLANRMKALQIDVDSSSDEEEESVPELEKKPSAASSLGKAIGAISRSGTNASTESTGSTSSSKGSGARFHEVVLAAARNKDLLEDES